MGFWFLLYFKIVSDQSPMSRPTGMAHCGLNRFDSGRSAASSPPSGNSLDQLGIDVVMAQPGAEELGTKPRLCHEDSLKAFRSFHTGVELLRLSTCLCQYFGFGPGAHR